MLRTLVLLSLVIAPVATAVASIQNPAESTPTTLYFHVIGHDDMPINTQKPSDTWTAQDALGLGTASSSCVPPVPGEALTGQEHHTFYGYSSPSIVEYNVTENGRPRTHPERGLSSNAELDTAKPWVTHWYLKTQAVTSDQQPGGPGTDPNRAPIVIPNVVVQVTVRTGDGISIGDAAYNSGAIIAQGKTDPLTLAGPATDSLDKGKVGYEGYNETGANASQIYGFAVPMTINSPLIPKVTGYNVRIDVYMDNGACNDPGGAGYLMPNNVRIYSDPNHRPRMELNVLNPLRIESLQPEFHGGRIRIYGSPNSPWGNYDVDRNVTWSLQGPTPALHASTTLRQSVEEEGYDTLPVQATLTWNYTAEGARLGWYTVVLNVTNLQHSAQAVAFARFNIGTGQVEGCSATGCGVHVDAAGVVRVSPIPVWIPLVALAFLAGRRNLMRHPG
ncbi:MAG: hypothetical protein ACYDBQ_01390 [Thermoplasmatota archaeon]